MTTKLSLACALALLVAPFPALATEPAPPVAQAEIDPMRLAAAKVTVDAIFPPGTYARIMKTSMDAVMGPMMDGMKDMPLRQLAGMTGLKDDALSKLGDGTIREVLTIVDPAFDQRMQVTTRVMMDEMSGMMAQFEPGFREGLSRAYAKRFSVVQLSELNRFFATSTGALYASESMTIFTDPEVLAKMQEMIPQMLTEMPAITAKVETATAGIPKPKRPEDLSPAQRSKLARLLGISERELFRRRP